METCCRSAAPIRTFRCLGRTNMSDTKASGMIAALLAACTVSLDRNKAVTIMPRAAKHKRTYNGDDVPLPAPAPR